MKSCKIIEDFIIAMMLMRATILKMCIFCLIVDICVQNMTIDVFLAEIVSLRFCHYVHQMLFVL